MVGLKYFQEKLPLGPPRYMSVANMLLMGMLMATKPTLKETQHSTSASGMKETRFYTNDKVIPEFCTCKLTKFQTSTKLSICMCSLKLLSLIEGTYDRYQRFVGDRKNLDEGDASSNNVK